MNTLILFMIVVLFIIIAIMLYRVIKGPTSYDRQNGINIISANTVILLVLFGFLDGRPDMYIDIAIAYALIGFIGNIVLAKYLESKGKKNDN